MKQKLIIFIIAFFPFALIMWMLVEPVYLGVGIALLYALLTTFALSLIQRINLIRTGQHGKKIQVHNEVILEIATSKEEAFQLCTDALGAIAKCSIGISNPSKGLITATTGVNWLTWGDELSVHIEPRDNYCRIRLTSSPKIKTTVIDYGKNRDNIKIIVEHLQRNPYTITVVRDGGEIVQAT